MDQLDRYIENIVSQKISEPENLDKIIMDAISFAKYKKKKKENKIRKIILTLLIAIFFLSGVGIAGYITYERIWKNSEKYTYEEIQESSADTKNTYNTNISKTKC